MKLNVPHIAKLANLSVNPDEEKKLEKQLSETLEYIERLSEIDTENVHPISHVTGLENVTREDRAKPSLTQEQALANAQNNNKTYQSFFKVNAVLPND